MLVSAPSEFKEAGDVDFAALIVPSLADHRIKEQGREQKAPAQQRNMPQRNTVERNRVETNNAQNWERKAEQIIKWQNDNRPRKPITLLGLKADAPQELNIQFPSYFITSGALCKYSAGASSCWMHVGWGWLNCVPYPRRGLPVLHTHCRDAEECRSRGVCSTQPTCRGAVKGEAMASSGAFWCKYEALCFQPHLRQPLVRMKNPPLSPHRPIWICISDGTNPIGATSTWPKSLPSGDLQLPPWLHSIQQWPFWHLCTPTWTVWIGLIGDWGLEHCCTWGGGAHWLSSVFVSVTIVPVFKTKPF